LSKKDEEAQVLEFLHKIISYGKLEAQYPNLNSDLKFEGNLSLMFISCKVRSVESEFEVRIFFKNTM